MWLSLLISFQSFYLGAWLLLGKLDTGLELRDYLGNLFLFSPSIGYVVIDLLQWKSNETIDRGMAKLKHTNDVVIRRKSIQLVSWFLSHIF